MAWALVVVVGGCGGLSGALLSATPARAQGASGVDPMVVALDPSGFVGLTGTPTPGHLRWEAALSLGYLARPVPRVFEGALIRRGFMDVEAELGLGKRAALALGVPFAFAQASQQSEPAGDVPAAGVGDPRLVARYRLIGALGQGGRQPDGPGLGVSGFVTAPVGSEAALTGNPGLGAGAALTGDFHLLGAGAILQLGYAHLAGDAARDTAGWPRHRMTFGAALRSPLPFYTPLAVALEARGSTDFSDERLTPVELDLGLRWSHGPWLVMLATGVGLTDAVGAPDGRVLLGLRYRAETHDRDGDGIPDADDACPLLPEDRDGFEDADGCEDPDNDNDWIPDVDDLCPNEEALEGQDADEDGCTDRPTGSRSRAPAGGGGAGPGGHTRVAAW